MKTPIIVAAVALFLSFGIVQSQTTPAQPAPTEVVISETAPAEIAKDLKAKVEAWTGGRFTVEGVRTTPMPGIFEVQIRTDLFFVDRAGRYIIVEGEMVDMTTNLNITQERMKSVMSIDFSELPLEKAVKQVNGDGKRVVALFEDPNCAYCRRLRADLNGIDNITVYTFAYPILAADSDTKSRKALCAKDPSKAWNELMISGIVPDNAGDCENALDEFKEMGQRYGIHATPTMFFPSGYRLQGYAPPTKLVQLMDAHQTAGK